MSSRHRSLVTLVVAAAAVGSALVGTVAAPGHAATARLDESNLSIRVAHPRIEAGDTTRILGDLHVRGGQSPSGRVVTLEARPEGATVFTPVGTAVAAVRGGVSLTVQPTVTTRYRWSYAGDASTRPSRSGVGRVRIVVDQHHGHRLSTSLSVRAAHRVTQSDGSNLVRGRLRTHGVGLAHRTVSLLSRPAGSATPWQVVDQRVTDRVGSVQFPVAPTARSAYRLRFDGTPVFRPSHSGIVRVAVRPLVTAVATTGWIDPGATATVTGAASLAGQPLVGAAVDLVARPVGRRGPGHVVGSGVTAADGSVTITDTPAVSTAYRLVVRHSTGVPRASSAVVRVKVRAPSSLSIRGRHTASGYVVSGVLRGDHRTVRHAQVDLQVLAADGVTWTTVTSAFSGKHGKVSFLEPSSEGSSYRLSYAGGVRLAPCVSGTVVS